MKINEVVNEAWYDPVTKLVPGTQANIQSKARKIAGPGLKNELQDWKTYLAQRGPVMNMQDPDVFRKQLEFWADSRFPSSKDWIDVSQVDPKNNTSIENYIANRLNTAIANRSTGTTQPPGKPQEPEPTASVQEPQQPASSDVLQQLMTQAGVKVVNDDPIVLDYRGTHYGLNDKGQWAHLKTGKVPAESLQAFLSQVHDIQLKSGSSGTTSPGGIVIPPGAKTAGPAPAPAQRSPEPSSATADYNVPAYQRRKKVVGAK